MNGTALLIVLATGTGLSTSDLSELHARARNASTPELRLEALRAIASLQTGGGTPREDVTQALAVGLEDPSAENRRATAALLAEGQHPEIAVRELVGAADAAHGKWEKAWREFDKLRAKPPALSLDLDRIDLKDLQANQERLEKFNAKIAALLEEIQIAASDRDAFVTPLALLPDDRGVRVLAEIVDGTRLDPGSLVPIDVLLALDCRKSLDASVNALARCAARAREARADVDRLEKSKERIRGEHADQERERIEKTQAGARARLEWAESYAEAIATRVRALATRRSLPAPPGGKDSLEAWDGWRIAARAALPESLGRVAVPRPAAEGTNPPR